MHTIKTSKARENILSRIRKGLGNEAKPMPFSEVEKEQVPQAFAKADISPEEQFAQNFIALGGKFVFCDNEKEFLESVHDLYDSRGWQQLYCADDRLLHLFQNNKLNIVQPVNIQNDKADACITACEFLVARTGSVLLSSKQPMGRTSTVFYPVHIMVAYTNQVLPDIANALDAVKKKYTNGLPSMINLNTGPSRTADIEKTLVVGVHGPGEVFCFLINA
ncbi:MAG: LUD domain-containing protein [Bacteroidetes bacterium]|nr:LUD domain-containing protein [Bacteroidota bacterium]